MNDFKYNLSKIDSMLNEMYEVVKKINENTKLQKEIKKIQIQQAETDKKITKICKNIDRIEEKHFKKQFEICRDTFKRKKKNTILKTIFSIIKV